MARLGTGPHSVGPFYPSPSFLYCCPLKKVSSATSTIPEDKRGYGQAKKYSQYSVIEPRCLGFLSSPLMEHPQRRHTRSDGCGAFSWLFSSYELSFSCFTMLKKSERIFPWSKAMGPGRASRQNTPTSTASSCAFGSSSAHAEYTMVMV